MSIAAIKVKEEIVAKIQDKIQRSKGIVIVDYRGISVKDDTDLRASLRKEGVEYQVLKNNIMLRALEGAGYTGFEDILKGPTAVAFSYNDAIAPAKILVESAKKYSKMKVKGGLIEGKAVSADELTQVAKIPSKEILLAMLLNVLTAPMRGFAVAISEVAKKSEQA